MPEGVLSQWSIAYFCIGNIQLQLNKHIKRQQQDVQTRWKSAFYMLLSENKPKHLLYSDDHIQMQIY